MDGAGASGPGAAVGSPARGGLGARLKARRTEIERAALTRVYAIADPIEAADPQYADGLKRAVGAALDYGIAAVEHGEERAPDIPPTLLAQARLAARNGVSLDTVLRRYFAGYTLLSDFLVQEVEAAKAAAGIELKRLLQTQAALFDRLVATVSEEYMREAARRLPSPDQRRVQRVQRLLDGELLDITSFPYDFEGWHVGVIAIGPGATEALRGLAGSLDRTLLLVRPAEDTVWAWLGGRQQVATETMEGLAASWPKSVVAALGEPARGIAGWRLTHRQAKVALRIVGRGGGSVVSYAKVGLVASILQDDVLATSLRELYLTPLSEERDGGRIARETLRAYFAADRNVSSAAAALGVSRQTVGARLRAIEQRLGQTLNDCAVELEVALRIETSDAPLVPGMASRFANGGA